MIKKLEAKDIIKISNLNKSFPCEKGQYIQYLMQKLTDNSVMMLGNIEDDKVLSYAVVLDNREPPIFNSMSIYEMWSEDHRETLKLTDEIKKVCDRIIVITPDDEKHNDKYMATFGCKKIANVYEWVK